MHEHWLLILMTVQKSGPFDMYSGWYKILTKRTFFSQRLILVFRTSLRDDSTKKKKTQYDILRGTFIFLSQVHFKIKRLRIIKLWISRISSRIFPNYADIDKSTLLNFQTQPKNSNEEITPTSINPPPPSPIHTVKQYNVRIPLARKVLEPARTYRLKIDSPGTAAGAYQRWGANWSNGKRDRRENPLSPAVSLYPARSAHCSITRCVALANCRARRIPRLT